MKVFIDDQLIPSNIHADLYIGETPRVTIQSEFSDDVLKLFKGYLDGKPHVVTFADDDGNPKMVAHAKFELRIASSGIRNINGTIELSGTAWGPPPNYNQFFVIEEE